MFVFRHFTIFVGIGRLKAVRLKGRGINRATELKFSDVLPLCLSETGF